MSILAGVLTVLNAKEQSYEDRKYYSCQGLDQSKEVFNFSAPFEDHPKEGDHYQMIIERDSHSKARVRYVKEK